MAEDFKIQITTAADVSGAEQTAAVLDKVGEKAKSAAESVQDLATPIEVPVDSKSVEAATAALIQALQARGELAQGAFVEIDVNDDSVKDAIASIQTLKEGLTDEELRSVTIDVSGFENISAASTSASADMLNLASTAGTLTSAGLDVGKTFNLIGGNADSMKSVVKDAATTFKGLKGATTLAKAGMDGASSSAFGLSRAISALFNLGKLNPYFLAAAAAVGIGTAAWIKFKDQLAYAKDTYLKVLDVLKTTSSGITASAEKARIFAEQLGSAADQGERLRKALDELGDTQQAFEMAVTERDLSKGLITEEDAAVARAKIRAGGEQRKASSRQEELNRERLAEAATNKKFENEIANATETETAARQRLADARFALRGVPSDQSYEVTRLRQERDATNDPAKIKELSNLIGDLGRQTPTFKRAGLEGDKKTNDLILEEAKAKGDLEVATASITQLEFQLAKNRDQQAVAEKARKAEEESLRLRGVTSNIDVERATIDAQKQAAQKAEQKAKAAEEEKAAQEKVQATQAAAAAKAEQRSLKEEAVQRDAARAAEIGDAQQSVLAFPSLSAPKRTYGDGGRGLDGTDFVRQDNERLQKATAAVNSYRALASEDGHLTADEAEQLYSLLDQLIAITEETGRSKSQEAGRISQLSAKVDRLYSVMGRNSDGK